MMASQRLGDFILTSIGLIETKIDKMADHYAVILPWSLL